jgi:hypothetical protein
VIRTTKTELESCMLILILLIITRYSRLDKLMQIAINRFKNNPTDKENLFFLMDSKMKSFYVWKLGDAIHQQFKKNIDSALTCKFFSNRIHCLLIVFLAQYSNFLTVEEQIATIMFEELLYYLFKGQTSKRLAPLYAKEKIFKTDIGTIWFDSTTTKFTFAQPNDLLTTQESIDRFERRYFATTPKLKGWVSFNYIQYQTQNQNSDSDSDSDYEDVNNDIEELITEKSLYPTRFLSPDLTEYDLQQKIHNYYMKQLRWNSPTAGIVKIY